MRKIRLMRLGPLAALGLVLLIAAMPARAATAVVKDGANFFSADAVQKANAQLQALQQQYKHTVIVETFATPPEELAGKLGGDEASRNQAFNAFCDTHAFSVGADVYVLINKAPPHLQVWARDNVQRSGLTPTGREGLTKELASGFRNKDYDGALGRMTAGLERTFSNESGGTPQATPPTNAPGNTPGPVSTPDPTPARTGSGGGLLGGIGCIGLLVILFVLFLVVRLVRRLFGGGGSPPPGYGGQGYGGGGYGGGYGGGGGGMGRGLFGGLLGGLFGSYLGNRTFGQGPSEPSSGGGIFGGGGGDTSGGSSSGADFGPSGGDTSSGADFGGGGGGGGDSGGGGSSSGSDF